ncbi:STAS domain-containing protein [Streptomyces sp. NPDC048383]|uniref:STAS domain-containing protein n=1 Tax=Streptomyces sp. NPDC048383 TaxID=3155386 RepID=UPI003444E610
MITNRVPDIATDGFPVEVTDHTVTVRVSGEIDLLTGGGLHRSLTKALRHATANRPLVVDFHRVTFCDSAGLNALITARITAEKKKVAIRLTGLNHQTRRLLEVTGALPLFTVT